MPTELSKEELESIIPHRGIAMPDNFVIALEDDHKSATAIKKLPTDEKYFEGHFPEMAILPGHWILEMCAITAAVLVRKMWDNIVKEASWLELIGKPGVPGLYSASLIFKRPLTPGDLMIINMELVEVDKILRSPKFVFRGNVLKEKNGKRRECTVVESLVGVSIVER